MNSKPRCRSGLVLIVSSFAGQAAMVAAVIALLLAAAHASRPSHAPVSGWATPSTAVIGPDGWPAAFGGNMPPMWYATRGPGQDSIEIRNTASGAGFAGVRPPPGFQTFSLVMASNMAGVYLVAAQGWQPAGRTGPLSGVVNAAPVRLYTLRLNPVPEPGARLTPLPLPEIPGDQFWSAALSPDTSRIALALTPGVGGLRGAAAEVRVYGLRDRSVTTWSVTARGRGFNGPRLDPRLLSWSADNRLLGINWRDPAPGMRVLNAGSRGGSLLTASRMIALPGCHGNATLTIKAAMVACAGFAVPDGGAASASDGPRAAILEFDAITGHPLRSIVVPLAVGGKPVQEVRLLWVSPTGQGFIVTSYTGSSWPAALTTLNMAGRVAQGIPLWPGVTEFAW